MIGEIRTAIYTQTLTAASLNANNTWWMKAPQGDESDPYCVITFVSNPFTRDSSTYFEELTFQVNLYGTSVITIEGIELEVKDVFKNAESALNALLSTVEITAVLPNYSTLLDIDDETWQIAIRFKLMIKEL